VAGALEYALASKTDQPKRLSVEFLNWASNQAMGEMRDGGFFSDIWRGFTIYGACPEQDMPYQIILTPTGRPARRQRITRAKCMRSISAALDQAVESEHRTYGKAVGRD